MLRGQTETEHGPAGAADLLLHLREAVREFLTEFSADPDRLFPVFDESDSAENDDAAVGCCPFLRKNFMGVDHRETYLRAVLLPQELVDVARACRNTEISGCRFSI